MPRLDEEAFDSYRAVARELSEQRSECSRASQMAYQNGNKQRAKLLSIRAKGFQREINEANKIAAK